LEIARSGLMGMESDRVSCCMKFPNNIVVIHAGLGNQMFQYAFGLAVDAAYDNASFAVARQFDGGLRSYGLDQFACRPRILSTREFDRCCRGSFLTKCFGRADGGRYEVVHESQMNVFDSALLSMRHKIFFGFFQCEKYFLSCRERLLREFVLVDPESSYTNWCDRISERDSVSVHIRRGDYLQTPALGICSPEYYAKAMSFIATRVRSPKYYFFSDDPEWTRKNFSDVPGAVFVDGARNCTATDMMLMSKCHHHIIANSSYSWWGAWLDPRPDKIVVAPQKWFADGTPTDIVPETWVRV